MKVVPAQSLLDPEIKTGKNKKRKLKKIAAIADKSMYEIVGWKKSCHSCGAKLLDQLKSQVWSMTKRFLQKIDDSKVEPRKMFILDKISNYMRMFDTIVRDR